MLDLNWAVRVRVRFGTMVCTRVGLEAFELPVSVKLRRPATV